VALSKTCGIRTLKQVDTLTTSMSRPFIRPVSASAYNLIKRLSKIVTPFLVFEENWDPNAVITMADDQGHTPDVKLLELLCFTRTRHKAKVADALKREKEGLPKSINKGCQSI